MMKSTRIAVSAGPGTDAPQFYKPFMKRFISIFICCLAGTAVEMGSGSGGGGGGGGSAGGGSGGSGSGGGSSTASIPLQQEVGATAFQAYNRGVDLMHVRKFAAAQAMFEKAIRENPNFAEAHNIL